MLGVKRLEYRRFRACQLQLFQSCFRCFLFQLGFPLGVLCRLLGSCQFLFGLGQLGLETLCRFLSRFRTGRRFCFLAELSHFVFRNHWVFPGLFQLGLCLLFRFLRLIKELTEICSLFFPVRHGSFRKF